MSPATVPFDLRCRLWSWIVSSIADYLIIRGGPATYTTNS